MNNDINFKKFLAKIKKNNSNGIIYTYADWCQKCKLLTQKEFPYEVYHMNADNEQSMLELLDIRLLPTFTLIKAKDNTSFEILKQSTNVTEILN